MEVGRTRSGCSWKSQEVHQSLCGNYTNSVEAGGSKGKYMYVCVEAHGSRCKSVEVGMEACGSQWKQMKVDESQWTSVEVYIYGNIWN